MYVAAHQRKDWRDYQTSAEDVSHRPRQPPPMNGKIESGINTADASPLTDMSRDAMPFLQDVLKQPDNSLGLPYETPPPRSGHV